MTATTPPPPAAAGGQPAVSPAQQCGRTRWGGRGGGAGRDPGRAVAGGAAAAWPACCSWAARRPLGQALDEAAGWWMVYAALVDLGTLGVICWLLRPRRPPYRGLLGPPTAAWPVALGAVGVLAASVPAVVFSGELTSALYGDDAIPPMFAVVDLPPLASIFSVLVVPLLAELAEPVAYLGVVLPRLERRLGRPWLAATIVVPLGRRARLVPAADQRRRAGLGVRRLPGGVGAAVFWPSGPPPDTPWGGGCCRSWPPGGSSTPAPRPPWP